MPETCLSGKPGYVKKKKKKKGLQLQLLVLAEVVAKCSFAV